MSKENLKSANLDLWEETLKSISSNFVGAFVGFLLVIVLTNNLSVENVGRFFFYNALIYLCIQIPRGVGYSLRKRVSSTNENWSDFFFAGLIITVPGLLALIAALFLILPLSGYFSVELTVMGIAATGFSVFFRGMMQFTNFYLSGIGEPGLAEQIRNYISKGGTVVLVFISVVFFEGVVAPLASIGVAALIATVIMLYYAPLEFTVPDKEHYISILVFAKWSIPNSILNDFYHRFDTITLGIMVGSRGVSFYDTAVRISSFAFIFASSVAKASNPKISGMYESGRDITEISNKIIGMGTLFAYPAVIITFLHGSLILSIFYGSEYSAAKWFVVGLCLQQLLTSYRLQFESISNAIDKPEFVTTASVAAVIFNVITAIPLVLKIGGIGIVISTLFAEILRAAIFEYHMKSTLGQFLYSKDILYQFIAGLAALLVTYSRIELISVSELEYIAEFVSVPVSNLYLLVDFAIVILTFGVILYYLSDNFREILSASSTRFKNVFNL